MIDYSWLKNTPAPKPTAEAKRAFALARADQYDSIADENEARGNHAGAKIARDFAASLRGEA